MYLSDEDILLHYGTKRHSGRYPWGSGEHPYQRSGDFLSRVEELQQQGLSEKEIAGALKMSTTDLRLQMKVAKHERDRLLRDHARSLREDGLSLNEIAQIMGYANDSSVRALLDQNVSVNKNRAWATADILRAELEKKGMLDVGANVELELGCSRGVLDEALFILQTEGYEIYGVGVPQINDPGHQTNIPVLCMPGTEHSYVYQHMGDIQSVEDYHSTDGGTTYNKVQYPASIDSDRIFIKYGDKGGKEKDGVIEIRRGVDDLSLGDSHYAQVRILVDGTHYLKGMAMYSDDIPEGVDIVFNTNKLSGTDKMKVLKSIKEDPDNPFGATITAAGQSMYFDADGNEHLSAINKLKSEGDWDDMSRTLSQQFLSKQPKKLIDRQLDLTYADAAAEYDEICSLTNPTVKKKMLLDFADECDSAAVHMKAAALPRQKTQVLLPLDEIADNEVFAPNYKNGEEVALIRYPHGGTFEIPILTVNNKNQKGIDNIGLNAKDAVGINAKVAERLSGADFDGDTVTVIPISSKVKITSTKALEGLIGFDAKEKYAIPEGNPQNVSLMKKSMVQKQMGMISNLITDMTLQGANEKEITRAVKHSMVVIDAEKHKLDYKQSEKDNGIAELREKYQKRVEPDGTVKVGGASTLLSRRKQDVQVPERKGSPMINKETGELSYKTSGRTYKDPKTGKYVEAKEKVSLMSVTKDAHELSTGTVQEEAYANFANKMKSLANAARKTYANTGNLIYKATAKETYSAEVASLNKKLEIAAKNAPRERRAQIIANSTVKAKKQENPSLEKDKKELKKIGQIAINSARSAVGASGKDSRIQITDREWDAIQSGAITDSKLSQILRYADSDKIKERAMPKSTSQLSTAKINKMKSMMASGYSNSDIAKALGVSTSTVIRNLNN